MKKKVSKNLKPVIIIILISIALIVYQNHNSNEESGAYNNADHPWQAAIIGTPLASCMHTRVHGQLRVATIIWGVLNCVGRIRWTKSRKCHTRSAMCLNRLGCETSIRRDWTVLWKRTCRRRLWKAQRMLGRRRERVPGARLQPNWRLITRGVERNWIGSCFRLGPWNIVVSVLAVINSSRCYPVYQVPILIARWQKMVLTGETYTTR